MKRLFLAFAMLATLCTVACTKEEEKTDVDNTLPSTWSVAEKIFRMEYTDAEAELSKANFVFVDSTKVYTNMFYANFTRKNSATLDTIKVLTYYNNIVYSTFSKIYDSDCLTTKLIQAAEQSDTSIVWRNDTLSFNEYRVTFEASSTNGTSLQQFIGILKGQQKVYSADASWESIDNSLTISAKYANNTQTKTRLQVTFNAAE